MIDEYTNDGNDGWKKTKYYLCDFVSTDNMSGGKEKKQKKNSNEQT